MCDIRRAKIIRDWFRRSRLYDKTSTDLKFSWRHGYSVRFKNVTDLEVCQNMDAWLWLLNVWYPGRVWSRARLLCITSCKALSYKPTYLCLSRVRRRKWVYSFVVTGDTAAISLVSSNVDQLESYTPFELLYAVRKGCVIFPFVKEL